MDITIHFNTALSHQREHAELFRKGFKRHGITAIVTPERLTKADIHIVMGPHYAKDCYLNHDNVILLDRCYYKGNPDHVSIGWMNNKGGRDFIEGEGRQSPEIKESVGNKSLFIADYNGKLEKADIVRLHPSNNAIGSTLEDDIKQCNRATGYNTTALVTAALGGLEITCKGETSILNNKNWLKLLPYADWHNNEIGSGEVWHHLQLSHPQLTNL